MRLADIVKRNLKLSGDRTALIFQGRHFSYRELTERIYRLANCLRDLGIKPHDRIAVLAYNCNEYIELYGACEVAGLTIVPLNHRLTLRELSPICADCSPRLIFAQREFMAMASELSGMTGSLEQVIEIGRGYEELLSAASADEPTHSPGDEDTAYLIYTSGTTGNPKGVMLSQRAVAAAARCIAHDGSARASDTMLICMPFFHIGGRIEQLAFSLMGATIVLHRAFDEAAVLNSIAEHRVTAAHLAPTMIQRLLDRPDLESFELSTLRGVHYASAPMPVPLLRRAMLRFGPIFTQIYGMTECIVSSILKPHQHVLDGAPQDLRRLASAGQPFLGVEIKIASDDGVELPTGEIGEILVRSPAMMKGYWNNTGATIGAIYGDWMRTSDLGTVDEDGYITILDRKKDMIISGGENIYSWEVEEALRAHPDVAEVAVVGVPDETWGEAVRAFVVRRTGREPTSQSLIDHCRTQIASYKKPRSIIFVDELPRMFHGKIDKKVLRNFQAEAGQPIPVQA